MAEAGPSTLPNLAPSGGGDISLNTSAAIDHLPFTDAQLDDFREQDRWLPIANVARIMKTSLPTSAKISKEAKECVQECVSEFISFITSEAAEKCLNEKRKTINGEDVLTSTKALGFENYEGVLKIYLAKLREAQSVQAKQKMGDSDDGSRDGNSKRGLDADGSRGSIEPPKKGRKRRKNE